MMLPPQAATGEGDPVQRGGGVEGQASSVTPPPPKLVVPLPIGTMGRHSDMKKPSSGPRGEGLLEGS